MTTGGVAICLCTQLLSKLVFLPAHQATSAAAEAQWQKRSGERQAADLSTKEGIDAEATAIHEDITNVLEEHASERCVPAQRWWHQDLTKLTTGEY